MTLQRLAITALALLMLTMCIGCGDSENGGDATATKTTAAEVTTTTAEPITAETKIGVIEASTYIVRTGPGLDYESVGGLQQDEEVVIVDREGDWYKIEFGDGFGYINSQYVTIVGQTTYTTKATTTTTKATTTQTVTTVTDENGNVVTTTVATNENGETVPTQNGTVSGGDGVTDNTEINYENIPGVVIEDDWDF